jgi:hypothetical protein
MNVSIVIVVVVVVVVVVGLLSLFPPFSFSFSLRSSHFFSLLYEWIFCKLFFTTIKSTHTCINTLSNIYVNYINTHTQSFLLEGEFPLMDLIGIGAGHAYYILYTSKSLPTPLFLKKYFDNNKYLKERYEAVAKDYSL